MNMEMEMKSGISGFILAGGKSTRMGSDKALLNIDNEPLLKRMIKLVDSFCADLSISGQRFEYEVFNVNMISDMYSGCGPISGIFSSLYHSKTHWNLLLSVDVPFVNEELIRFLISNMGEFDCIIPVHNQGIEPLIGLYHRRTLPVIEEMISCGDYKLTNLLSRLNTCYLDCNDLVKQYPRLFMNINRMEDYQAI